MGEKEISVSFDELNRMEVYCPKCSTGILLDFLAEKFFLPTDCSACGANLPDHICTAMNSYRHFFQNAKDSKARLKFRIKDHS